MSRNYYSQNQSVQHLAFKNQRVRHARGHIEDRLERMTTLDYAAEAKQREAP